MSIIFDQRNRSKHRNVAVSLTRDLDSEELNDRVTRPVNSHIVTTWIYCDSFTEFYAKTNAIYENKSNKQIPNISDRAQYVISAICYWHADILPREARTCVARYCWQCRLVPKFSDFCVLSP